MSYGFPKNPNFSLPILSKADIEAIHCASLDILRRTGIRIQSQKCLEILHDMGCEIDTKKQVAHIPSHLVGELLKKRKSVVRLCARNPKYNITLDGQHIHVDAFGTANTTLDLETGRRRPSVTADIVNSAKIVNNLDSLHMSWPAVTSFDVPAHIRNLHDIKTALCSYEKHVQFETGEESALHARYVIRMGAAICGGQDELKRNPIMSSCHCPISPLSIAGGSAEAALEYASAGVPVFVGAAPMPGATSPVTLAGSIALTNAEVLGGFVLIQSASSGAPFIYGGNVAPMDMRTCRRAGGSVENALMDAGMAQVSKYLGLPSHVDMYSTANSPGSESCIEKPFFLLPFVNADIIGAAGCIEDGKTFSFEQQVIDAELVQLFIRVDRGIEVNDTTLAADLIDKVQPGGTYLAEKHTNAHLRTEYFIPSLMKRQTYDLWVKDGSKTIVDLAREKARKIIQESSITPLDKNIQENLERIMLQADKEFSTDN
jgi:trimethylamine--corrinoid protein Co-methyltransferase